MIAYRVLDQGGFGAKKKLPARNLTTSISDVLPLPDFADIQMN